MKTIETAIETTATISADHQLVLDDPLPLMGSARVRVILLLQDSANVEEAEWLRAGMTNSAFDFLNAPGEDIYTINDGNV